jgi:hypothetical protein
MNNLNILFLFIFVLSNLYVLNLILNIIRNIFSEFPNKIKYSLWEKLANYFFISYLVTYIITKTF